MHVHFLKDVIGFIPVLPLQYTLRNSENPTLQWLWYDRYLCDKMRSLSIIFVIESLRDRPGTYMNIYSLKFKKLKKNNALKSKPY